MIPFNQPFIAGKELEYFAQAVRGGHISGNGKFTKLCQEWMQNRYGLRKVLLTHSCTAALEMAALLLDIVPGDEVILPSFTFVSTANAFVLRGAKLRFVDIREDTLNIDETLIAEAINERTKAIVVVHYAGVACEMDAILKVASKHSIPVVEDAAQAVHASYKGKALGSFGDLGCYSFHETKNFISGEGGALAINREKFVERAEIIWEKGTNRAQFFKGQTDKYTWVDIGSSYLPSDLIAAFLYAQLEHADQIHRKRRAIHQLYMEQLAGFVEQGFLRLPVVPEGVEHNGHLFYIQLPSPQQRDAMLAHLNQSGVNATFHYIPLHSSPMGLKHSAARTDLPVTTQKSVCLIRLPCYYTMMESDVCTVVKTIKNFMVP